MAESKPAPESAEKAESPIPALQQVTEHQRELASHALQEFDKHNYEGCCHQMGMLHSQRERDPKVVHNRAIAQFSKSGYTKTEEFKRQLNYVCQLAHITPETVDNLDDVDHGIIFYNQAVILYHLRQYRTALSIMDKLFLFVEPLDEYLAKKVMLLVIELFLCTYQPDKALGMLVYTEKAFFTKTNNSPDKGDKAEEKESRDSRESSQDSLETWRPKISQFKTRCYLMLRSLKSCKRELKSLMNFTGSPPNISYLKSHFEYLRGNYRKAMKILTGTAPPDEPRVTPSGHSLHVMYYNNIGCVNYHLHKHNLGVFFFKKALVENDNVIRQLANGKGSTLSKCPVNVLSINRHYELQYNIGIELLHCSKPLVAFDCLIQAVQRYQMNPRLWLRIAECCIMVHKEDNEDDRKLSKRLEVIQGSVGSGVHRKLIIGTGVKTEKPSTEPGAIPVPSLEFASLCLRNALSQLPEDPLDAEAPVPDADDLFDTENKPTNSEPELVLAPPGNPLGLHEVANLRCSVLCASSYVSLCLNDYVMAMYHAENLLRQPKLSGAHRYLGRMYLSEALVHLDKIADAIQHLDLNAIDDVSHVMPKDAAIEQDKWDKNDKDFDNSEASDTLYPWYPKDVPRARSLMQYNLAVSHAIREEYDKSLAHLTDCAKFAGNPLPAQMYFLKIYLDLISGRRKRPHAMERRLGSTPGDLSAGMGGFGSLI